MTDTEIINLLMILFNRLRDDLAGVSIVEKSCQVSTRIFDNLEPEGTATYMLPDGRALMIEMTIVDAKTTAIAFKEIP